MTAVVCAHGWGFGPELWDDVRTCIAPIPSHVLDFGFFGPPRIDFPDEPFVVAAHSAGLAWAMEHVPGHCLGFAAINGFTRFVAGQDFPTGTPPRVLARMQAGFARTPERVLRDFRTRCGTDASWPRTPCMEGLARGLESLATLDVRTTASRYPLVALAGTHDPIAPPGLTRACFAQDATAWVEGGHLLPLTHPDMCGDVLRAFIRTVAS
jgi:pimeloyl-[acyl-carrier protein] methyl ester esterase